MKNIVLKSKTLALSAVLGIAILMTGCSKEDAMSPSSSTSSTDLNNRNGAPAPGTESIAQIAIDNNFTQLVAALSYVDDSLNLGLVDMFMNGTDQYTVFAPTDSAFNNLYTALGVTGISDLPPTLVRDVLLYHVTDGRRAANSVVPPTGTRTITPLLGIDFTVSTAGVITAVGNTANITTANISASNGIIHVIDAVILPI